ncbi:gamma-glutamyltranspeptidase [Dichotomopilus funicola]|uniref:Gamma-glutamyltranspeptidase n=1 Tax=Dichotomopilus funicola TaxID=1934379 RepID=A0AAN6VDJ0_9PEZI|nr:gamma-glutamyltranspeptidase [Dichotomopilus funicola]
MAPLTTPSVYPPAGREFMKWPSRRSVVHSTEGIVACTQPLAAKCGLKVLNGGGNAADAAVAVAAGLNMTEPTSTGIGGDMFCLFYDAAAGTVSALNGSGRSGAACTLEKIRGDLGLAEGEAGEIPLTSVHAATVPGAAAGWVDTVERFGSGKLSLEEILGPAIELGERGFPVSEDAGFFWTKGEASLRKASPNFAEMLKTDPSAPDGVRAPRAGDIMKNPNLARTFRTLATEGKPGFYTGRIAEEIVRVIRDRGGHVELADLRHHLDQGGSEPVDPISLKFRGQGCASAPRSSPGGGGGGIELWEHPPNGQGIVALMALGILQELEAAGTIPTFTPDDHNTTPYLHAIIESLRIAFADAHWFVTDPSTNPVPAAELISQPYLAARAKLFNPSAATPSFTHGDPTNPTSWSTSPALRSSDTVYFAVSDAQGNAISFINSNYAGFGTAMVPRGCGFTLQNRGANFSLEPGHPNALAPRKRPYHTIIPGLVTNLDEDTSTSSQTGGSTGAHGTKTGSLHSVFGVMGGFMQPQGHIQVLLGQIAGQLSPQQALDAPRICVGAGMADVGDVRGEVVYVEDGMPEETVEGLKGLGHNVKVLKGWGGMGRQMFGRGQVIRWTVDEVEGRGVWSGGSDMRGDGGAYPV